MKAVKIDSDSHIDINRERGSEGGGRREGGRGPGGRAGEREEGWALAGGVGGRVTWRL